MPIDVITQRAMITRVSDNNRIINIVRNIYLETGYGFHGFYKGYLVSVLMSVPFNSMIWTIYWRVQLKLERIMPHRDPSTVAIISATFASLFTCFFTQPIDVLKTRHQVASKRQTLPQTFRILIQDRGWIGLFSGGLPRACIVVPYSLIMMSTYEAIKRASKVTSS